MVEFNLEFNLGELQVILKGLEELPYKQSAPVRQSIIDQHTAILKEKEMEAKKDKEVVKSTKK